MNYLDRFIRVMHCGDERECPDEGTEDAGQYIESKKKEEKEIALDGEDFLWYSEEDTELKCGNSKQMDPKYLDLHLEFGNTNSDNDIIGDFVKMNISQTRSTNVESIYISDGDSSEQDSQELIELNETLIMPALPTALPKEEPIIPDFEIDYNNIYENIANASAIEKHLQLLYRPFICLVDVNCRFSLYELVILLENARYEPAHHPALFLRLRNPCAEIKIYAGGKIVASALSTAAARTAVLKVIHTVEQLGYMADITYFSKNKVHASFCLPFKVNLEMLSELHSEYVSANPEIRPFITYKFDCSAIRFAVFPNGYVLVLHSEQHTETRAAIAALLPILAHFHNGYLTSSERGDTVSFKLFWERRLEEDKEDELLYS